MTKKILALRNYLLLGSSLIPILVCILLLLWAKNRIVDEMSNETLRGIAARVFVLCQNTDNSETGKEMMKNILRSYRIGNTGYVFILQGSGEKMGSYVLSKNSKRDGENLWNIKDDAGAYIFREMIHKALSVPRGTSVIAKDYVWLNPGEFSAREKKACLIYYPPWDWVIGISLYKDDALLLAHDSNIVINEAIMLVIMLGLVTLLITFIFGKLITRVIREKEEELERVRYSLQNLVISDLKTPITALSGVVTMLKDPGLDEDVKHQLADVVVGAVSTQKHLLDTYTDLSRLESPDFIPGISSIDVEELLAHPIADLRPAYERRGITLGIDIKPEVKICHADPDLLEKIVWNLLSNALKCSSHNSAVRLAIYPVGGRVRFELSNNGPCIPEQIIRQLLDSGHAVVNHDPMLGLGLRFCRLAVEAHGGNIGVVALEGSGTMVWFELPVIKE